MASFVRLWIAEQRKIWQRLLFKGALFLLGGLVLLIYVSTYGIVRLNEANPQMAPDAMTQLTQNLIWPDALINAFSYAASSNLGGMVLIVLVGAVTAQEYTWRTYQLWLSRGVSRSMLILAKFGALFMPVAFVTSIPLLVAGVASAFFTVQVQDGIALSDVNVLQLLLSVLRTAYTLLPYSALTFLLAILSRSTVVSIGGGLAFALLLEGLVAQLLAALQGGIWERLWQYLPNGLGTSLLFENLALSNSPEGLSSQAALVVDVLPVPTAVIGIALYTLLFVVLALWVFQRQDLHG